MPLPRHFGSHAFRSYESVRSRSVDPGDVARADQADRQALPIPSSRGGARVDSSGSRRTIPSTRCNASVSFSTSDTPTDGELVRQARQGDEQAFSRLVERYQRPAYAVAFSVTGRHEDAEDAAQESFLVALTRLEECRNPDRFGGWLMTIVRNRSKNLIRRESLRETDQVPPGARSRVPTPDGWRRPQSCESCSRRP